MATHTYVNASVTPICFNELEGRSVGVGDTIVLDDTVAQPWVDAGRLVAAFIQDTPEAPAASPVPAAEADPAPEESK